MSISLRDVDPDNFRECIKLKVAAWQEDFVASNVGSIAESKVYPHLVPQAVYTDETLVGFAMYGRDPESEKYWIVRLMIDEQFQGRGYGRATTIALIEKIRKLPGADQIFLSFVPSNRNAESLYRSVGFERTGETYRDEIIMRLALKESDNRQARADN